MLHDDGEEDDDIPKGENENVDDPPAKKIQQYKLWLPEEIREEIYKWEVHYSDLLRVTNAQDEYGLQAAGGADDCPFDVEVEGCRNYILTIQDFVAHPEGSESSARLPEVLWSGEVHGNEVIGPTASLEAAILLLDAAECESKPRLEMKGSSEWDKEIKEALACRQDLKDRGIGDYNRMWLARLVATRRIVIIPTANALGYFRKVREEDGVDPNRDFPYDLTDPTKCMQTIAGRTLNEVFRQHMFQLSLTFHGGMEIVGYEWGAPSWKGMVSPDDIAENAIASAYSRFGGGFEKSHVYNYGDMNANVYPVRGGMEDWAYAGSWDPERVIQCEPTTYGGYSTEKTTYGPSTLRVFNMLVESSDKKIPPQEDLGTSEELLKHHSKGTGFVARNIRLCLLAADLLEPYVTIREVNELSLSDDIIPLVEQRPERKDCQASKAVSVPANSRKVVLQWVVGGAIHIDDTQLWYARWDDVPESVLDCTSQPSLDDIQQYMKPGTAISDTSGDGRFAKGPSESFSASILISDFDPRDKLVVIASALVDQAWAKKPDGNVGPDLPPQSHIVNVRTNSSWYHESEGKIIQGRLHWFSRPLTVELVEGSHVNVVELSNRLVTRTPKDGDEPVPASGGTDSSSVEKETGGYLVAIIVVSVLGVALFVVGRVFLQNRFRKAQRSRVREFIEDESAMSPGRHQVHNEKSRRNGYSDISDDGELEMGEYS